MKDNKGLLAGIGAVAVVIVAGIIIMMGGSDKKSDTSMGTTDTMATSMNDMDSSKTPAASTSDAVESNAVTIQSYAFAAPVIKVKVGTAVTWTNKDGVRHDVHPDKDSADFVASELLTKDQSYTFTFKKAGTYTYHCTPHPYMKGTVVVTE